MTHLDPLTGLPDFSKKSLPCPDCKGEFVMMAPIVRAFYKIEGGQATVGGTPVGTGFICIKCRRVLTDEDIMMEVGKREGLLDAGDETPPDNGAPFKV